jgi:hypothetical protein
MGIYIIRGRPSADTLNKIIIFDDLLLKYTN